MEACLDSQVAAANVTLCAELVAAPGDPSFIPVPTQGSAPEQNAEFTKKASRLKDKMSQVDYGAKWAKAKSIFWKGVEVLEAVSNKDLNNDGKIEGRKRPKTKEEQQAEWKKEHESRREEHEKLKRQWEAGKTKGSPDAATEKLSKEELDVARKIRALMAKGFRNDREQMFNHYDADQTGSLDHEEVRQVVKAAGVSHSCSPLRFILVCATDMTSVL